MATQDKRKLAHEMLDELEEEEIAEVIKKMLYIKGKLNKEFFPSIDPTVEELRAIKKAKKEFDNGESYTHEDVFGEEDYV